MKMKKLNKKLFVAAFCAMLLAVSFIQSSAGYKNLSLIMKDYQKSIQATCPVALFKGGALAGGDGVTYNIKILHIDSDGKARWKSEVSDTKLSPEKSGKPGGSFERNVQSWSGGSEAMKLTMKQTNKANPGIGWGNMTY